MTLWSWLYLGSAWTAITVLNVFCFYRIFTKKPVDKDDDRKN